MKRKNNFDGIIDSFDDNGKSGNKGNSISLFDGEGDPKAEKFERFIKKPATIGLFALLFAEFVMIIVLLCIAGSEKIVYDGSIAVRGVLNTAGIGSVGNYEELVANKEEFTQAEKYLLNYTAKESLALSMLSPSFVSFVQHDYNVKYFNGAESSSDIKDIVVKPETPAPETPAPDEPVSSETTEQATMAPAEKPTEKPTEIPSETPSEITTVAPDASGNRYYQFNLENYTYNVTQYSGAGSISTGVLSDNCTEKELVIGDEDFIYGNLVIQNSHGAPGFDLREVLSSPLVIPKKLGTGTEQIMLYYTHTTEAYCNTVGEKDATKHPAAASDDNTKNVVSCGTIIAEELNKVGVGVLNRTDVNDEDYNTAYDVSGQLLKDVTGVWDKLDLAIDIHSDSLEYPKGTWYGPVAESEGVSYAKMLFVVTVGEGNPHWKENIKMAMLLIEKLEAKVPGITRGILLRSDAKYNSTVTDKGLLVEMGFNGNLVTEAQASAKVLGEVLGEIYG